MVISLSFGMIRFVPDQVLGWIGGNMVNSVGAQSEDIAGGAAKNAFAGRGSITAAAGNASQARKMRNDSAQATQDKKDKEEREDGRTDKLINALTNGGGRLATGDAYRR